MHDPDEFQLQATKAIKDLQAQLGDTRSRLYALEGVMKSLLQQVPLAALRQIRENHDAEVVGQATQLAPNQQHPQYWEDWDHLLEQLARNEEQREGGSRKF